MDRPQWSVAHSMMDDLRGSLKGVAEARQRTLQVVGVAWSPDRLIRATVGPRGQLLELEIDPRVYRSPNATQLSASIVSTVRAAVEDASAKITAILDDVLPRNRRAEAGLAGHSDLARIVTSHDADLPTLFREEKP